MSFPQGIIFKATAGYDGTPGADDEEETGQTYPSTSAQGNSVGFINSTVAAANFRDRTTSNDARLCGTCFTLTTILEYRINLASSGSKNIRCALGDASSGSTTELKVYDNTSLLATITNTVAANEFVDASGTVRTAAAWPGSNSLLNLSFSTTTLIFSITAGFIKEIAYFYIEDAGGGGAVTFTQGAIIG